MVSGSELMYSRQRVHFRCEKCGGRIREYDGKRYVHPEERESIPLRMLLEKRKIIAGITLCDSCWEKIKEDNNEHIFDAIL